jgi:8-oxo-dGTP diphosphatase
MANSEKMNFCPYCGQSLIQKYFDGRHRPFCTSCEKPIFQDPKVAVAVLIEHGGKVLLIKRGNVPQRGKWTLPAGFVDAGEDPRHAAVRECKEETGFHIRIIDLLDVIHGKEHERGADIVIAYRGEIEGGVLKAGDDADDVAFFASDDIPPLAFKATHAVLSHLLSS